MNKIKREWINGYPKTVSYVTMCSCLIRKELIIFYSSQRSWCSLGTGVRITTYLSWTVCILKSWVKYICNIFLYHTTRQYNFYLNGTSFKTCTLRSLNQFWRQKHFPENTLKFYFNSTTSSAYKIFPKLWFPKFFLWPNWSKIWIAIFKEICQNSISQINSIEIRNTNILNSTDWNKCKHLTING